MNGCLILLPISYGGAYYRGCDRESEWSVIMFYFIKDISIYFQRLVISNMINLRL